MPKPDIWELARDAERPLPTRGSHQEQRFLPHRQARRIVTAVGAIGLVAAAVGTTLWTFADPSKTGPVFALYIGGIAVSYLAVLVAAVAVRSAKTEDVDRAAA